MKAKAVVLGLALIAVLVLAQPTVTITPLSVAPGHTVTISIRGQAGEKCGIEIVDPLNFKVYVKEITLTPAGEGTATWQVPTAARFGTYTVYVSCEITGATTAIFRVTLMVGGEARRDTSPLLMTAALASALTFVLIGIVKRIRK